ncbi:MAG TPA: MOSC domain-containing protein [Gemmatimonadaceae bacterium]|nr:MOSC domain-containing protein [Gemmatimonadaceae bacterium]
MIDAGSIAFINISAGGVPKHHLPSTRITLMGLEGDSHVYKHHGGPDRAVCLFSLELIDALREEGHPIFPGSTGENLTVTGAAWTEMIPGVILEIADTRMMITSFTTPCRTIRESFLDHHISRISVKAHPGWSRVYAKVLHEGTVSVGDSMKIIPS